jgi:glycogen synthase
VKVLMTGDTVGGVFTYMCELAAAVAERGVETSVALMGRPLGADQLRALGRAGVARVYAHDYELEWMDDPWRDVECASRWLLDIEAEVEPDVVHLNGYAHAALRWRAPTLVVGHSCVLSWWEAVHDEPAPPKWDRYREEVRRGLAAAGLVAAPTVAMLRDLRRLYAPRTETIVLPNGRRPRSLRRPKQPFVLGVGRLWDEAKNLAALDAAAARVRWPVLVAGDEPEPVARPRHARLLGRLSDERLAERFATASVFAAPAKYEPFGLAALEAGLAGCALVLGDVPSLREVWDDAAVFVAPSDAEALAAEINRLIDDRTLREALAGAAEQRAGTFTPDRMASAYVHAYERLLARALDEAEPLEVAS